MLGPVVRAQSAAAAPGDITTIVGGGIHGLKDGGPATSAELARPWGLARSGANLYVSDSQTGVGAPFGNRVRSVDASGTITTVLSGGDPPPGDGLPATQATLRGPSDVAFDAAGNLYIADSNHSLVRRVDATTGIITTYAGKANPSFRSTGDGHRATDAQIGFPVALVFDAAGNLYIADSRNNVIRRVDAVTHKISTVAGGGAPADGIGDGGPAAGASLASPAGLAIAADGNLLVADIGHSRVREVNLSTGVITTVAGNGGTEPATDGVVATDTSVAFPVGLVVDAAGNLYISSILGRVYKVDHATGKIATVAGGGTPADGLGDGLPATQAALNIVSPQGLAVNAAGDLFIADNFSRVRRVDHATGIITTYAGTGVTLPFNGNGLPAAQTNIAVGALDFDPSGNLLVTDPNNGLVRRIDATTTIVTTVAGGGVGDGLPGTQASVNDVRDLATDNAGNILIADCGDGRVRKYDVTTGIVTTIAGGGQPTGAVGDGLPATQAELLCPTGLYVVPPGGAVAAGTVFIADSAQNRVRRIDPNGIITTVAGTGVAGFNGDGHAATRAQLSGPSHVTVDAAGNIYISDTDNHRVRKIDAATGDISTVAGDGKLGLGGSGVAAISTEVTGPIGLLLDGSGNLLIADSAFQRIRSLDLANGIITTVAGTGVPAFGGDGGPALDANLDLPTEMIFDAAGNLDFTDRGNHRVRQIESGVPAPPPSVGCGAVITADTTLTADMGPCPGDGIIVGADNITLDLAGHTLTGSGPGDGTHAGILIRNHSGVTVTGNARPSARKATVTRFDGGVVIVGGAGNTVTNLAARNNDGGAGLNSLYGDGIVLFFTAHNAITDNIVVRNSPYDGIGLFGFGTDANTIQGNDVENNTNDNRGFGQGVGVGIHLNPFFSLDLPRGVSEFDNRLIDNLVIGNDNAGMSVLSNVGGVIRGNTADNNGHGTDFPNPGNGIGVQHLSQADPVTRVLVAHNQAHGNANAGIYVAAEGNRILDNDASFNDQADLQDFTDHGADTCDSNIWSGNIFADANPPCTTAGGRQVTAPGPVVSAAQAPAGTPVPFNRPIPPH